MLGQRARGCLGGAGGDGGTVQKRPVLDMCDSVVKGVSGETCYINYIV